jgi:protein-tyrosine phosphatase
LLRHRLEETGLEADIGSAGVLEPGHPASPQAVATMAARGIDLRAHRTRRLSAEDVLAADLVLGMERRHVRAAAVLAPSALSRSFTLKELVRRALVVGQRRPDESVQAWLARVGEGRDTAALARDDDQDTVADPLGGDLADFEACAEELDLLLRGLRHLLWVGGPLGAGGAGGAGTPGAGAPASDRAEAEPRH